jgi:hypothetical protein
VKWVYYGLVFMAMMTLNSCEKLFIDDSPGNISGMGNNNGELQIKEPYELPEVIVLIKPIAEGIIDGSLPRYGSGSVHLKITLLNYSDTAKTVYFPKGLIFKCNSPVYHNLMVLQTCWICAQPNGPKSFILDTYCINTGKKHLAPPDVTFEILGLSDSKVINNLLDLIGWRKINYEMIIGSPSVPKTDAYLDVMQPLRDLVWKLVSPGGNIADEDKLFIESIPELSASEIPPKDSLGRFPDYFEEFVVKGK